MQPSNVVYILVASTSSPDSMKPEGDREGKEGATKEEFCEAEGDAC